MKKRKVLKRVVKDDKNLRTTGSPKVSNRYGDGAPILEKVILFEGGQLKFEKRVHTAKRGGMYNLDLMRDGELKAVQRVYPLILDENLFLYSYWKYKSVTGNITKGADGKTFDGINRDQIKKLIEKLKTEKYKPNPTRVIKISKKTEGDYRKLSILTINDKLIQYVIKYILEKVYESKFSKYSHGYRPNRGAHTAIKSIQKGWKRVKWVIEGDIKSFFDEIDHHILIELIKKEIEDQQFIDLIWKILRAGTVDEKGIYKPTKKGVPQGSVISPLLSNIYLHELDKWMEEQLHNLNDKNTFISNPEYIKAKSLLRSKKDKKSAYKELKTIRSILEIGVRIYYVRYADAWLIGINGPKSLSIQLKDQVNEFLKNSLRLNLSEEKTKITELTKDSAEFLGFQLISWDFQKRNYHNKQVEVNKRASLISVQTKVPYVQICNKLIKEGFMEKDFKIKAINKWIHLGHKEILSKYNYIILGLVNYYKIAKDAVVLIKFTDYVLRHSCAKTIGRKLRLKSRKKVFKKFGKFLSIKDGSAKIISFKDIIKKSQSNKVVQRDDKENIFKVLQ